MCTMISMNGEIWSPSSCSTYSNQNSGDCYHCSNPHNQAWWTIEIVKYTSQGQASKAHLPKQSWRVFESLQLCSCKEADMKKLSWLPKIPGRRVDEQTTAVFLIMLSLTAGSFWDGPGIGPCKYSSIKSWSFNCPRPLYSPQAPNKSNKIANFNSRINGWYSG